MTWGLTALIALATSAFMSALLLGGLAHNTRMMLHAYPAIIQEAVPPKTPQERRLTVIYSMGTVAALFLAPLIYALSFGDENYLTIWLHIFAIGMAFNLVDLVIIDWLVVCRLTPAFVIVPGTETGPAFAAYKDYAFHFDGFIKGIAFCVVLPTVISGLTFIVNVLG